LTANPLRVFNGLYGQPDRKGVTDVLQKLIVCIEFEDDISKAALRERINEAIPEPTRLNIQGIGWRFFDSLEEALQKER